MYTTSKKITNNDAKNIISGQDVILVDDKCYKNGTKRNVFARLKGVIS